MGGVLVAGLAAFVGEVCSSKVVPWLAVGVVLGWLDIMQATSCLGYSGGKCIQWLGRQFVELLGWWLPRLPASDSPFFSL